DLPSAVAAGSRLPATPGDLVQNPTLIDQGQLLEVNPARLQDVLNRVTGIYADQAGTTGGTSSLYMRGAENRHLLVMVDGVKMNDPTAKRGSTYDLSSIDVGQLDRIEILRGPASAMHGAGALAGVLNIVTRSGVRSGVQGSAYAGTGEDGFQRFGATPAFGDERLHTQLGVGRSQDGRRSDDAWQRLTTVSGRVRLAPGSEIDGEAFARRTQRESQAFPEGSGGPRLAVNRAKTRLDASDTVVGAQGGMQLSPALRLQCGASIYERSERADNAAVAAGLRNALPASLGDTDFRRAALHATGTQALNPNTSLVFGFEHQEEHGSLVSIGDFAGTGSPQTLGFDLKRGTESLFAEGRMRVAPALVLQVGLRWDKIEHFRREISPQLGAVWNLGNGATTLKTSYGEGFELPSLFALGHPVVGNPNLEPERSRNFEAGLAHRVGGEHNAVQVSVFRHSLSQLVDFDSANSVTVNRGNIVIRGIEPSLKWQMPGRVRAQFGLSLLEIDAQDGLAPPRNRPEKRATASVAYDIGARSSLNAVLSYTSGFLDRSNPTGDIKLGGFSTLDLSHSVSFGPVQLKAAIDNLLDRNYEQFVGFPGQERRLRVEVRGSF
ncbi:MAG: TonB-dependent receptor, partial [Burkholderiaceae bacterium]